MAWKGGGGANAGALAHIRGSGRNQNKLQFSKFNTLPPVKIRLRSFWVQGYLRFKANTIGFRVEGKGVGPCWIRAYALQFSIVELRVCVIIS